MKKLEREAYWHSGFLEGIKYARNILTTEFKSLKRRDVMEEIKALNKYAQMNTWREKKK